MTPTPSNTELREKIEEMKDDLLASWRTEFHSGISGTSNELKEAEMWTEKVEKEVTDKLLSLIQEERENKWKMEFCPMCKGEGRLPNGLALRRCPVCDGSGKMMKENV
jgi:RecJ-like exonuclease